MKKLKCLFLGNRQKVLYGLVIIFWSALIIGSIEYFDIFHENSINKNISSYIDSMELNKNETCDLEPPANDTIVLRLDDVQAFAWSNITMKIISDTLDKNMSIALAVIPKDLDKDPDIDNFLINKLNETSKQKSPKIEIAQHGLNHEDFEFRSLSEQDSYNKIKTGLAKLIKVFGVYPVTFIPPNDEINENTSKALKRLNFKIVSSKRDEYKYTDGISYIGLTVLTEDYNDSSVLQPVDQIINICNGALDATNLCVINIHPQDFANPDGSLSYSRYLNYVTLLNNIDDLGIETGTFKDLIKCNDLK